MARACIPFHVKNTFITVGEEDGLDDLSGVKLSRGRGVTEPAYMDNNDVPKADREPSEPEQEQEPCREALGLGKNCETCGDAGLVGLAETIEEQELDGFDWRRLVTAVEFGVQPPAVAPEEPPIAIQEEPYVHAPAVNEASKWVFGAPTFQSWHTPSLNQGSANHVANANKNCSSQQNAEWGRITTVMMRNLPNKYTQGMLLEEVDAAGFANSYDFFYLPIDCETRANRGYAFINFRDSSYAWNFKEHFENHQMSYFNSDKCVTIVPATLQGFTANYTHYSKSRAYKSAPEMRPLFFRDNDQVVKIRHKRGGKASLIDLAARQKYVASKQEESLTRYCGCCGDAVEPNFRFCRSCGSPLQC